MITIRPAVTADLPHYLALLRHLQSGDPPLDPDKARIAFARMLAGGQNIVFLAVSGDALAASCTLTIIPNLTRNARPYAVIENVVTDPAFRRQGLAHAVLRGAQQAAWDADCYKIMLATGRPGLVAFYQAAGFVLSGKSYFEMRRT